LVAAESSFRSDESKIEANRKLINDYIYTCQQAIGATLDALPSSKNNVRTIFFAFQN